MVDQGALERLGQRYRLAPREIEQLRTLAQLLDADPFAPTAVRELPRVIDDHLADSLVALEVEVVAAAQVIADLGAGAGLPGLPLAIALPRASVWLVESAQRKCAFIERAAAACGLTNAHVVNARAEAWTEGIGRFDLVTARALAPLAVVAEYAAPLLRQGGAAVVWRGRRDRDDEAAARVACEELGLEAQEIRHVRPYDGAEYRHLHLLLKVMETPERFPRRPGVAAKRPLGARP